jgi:opacity protein-like surface antigen
MKRILVAAASAAIAAFSVLAADADYTAETGYVTACPRFRTATIR